MAQQINLCSPILLTEKRYFSAHTMAIALGVFLVLGTVLCAAWVWNLQSATQEFRATMDVQAREVASLQAALARSKANAAPVDAALGRQLQERQALLHQREAILAALQDGLLQPGSAHSDRLQLIARTIPAQVWVTALAATSTRMEISGFTQEPAALNGWVARLATSPLMQGLVLSDVTVENTSSKSPATPVVAAAAPSARAVWAFHLVNTQPALVPAATTGAKP